MSLSKTAAAAVLVLALAGLTVRANAQAPAGLMGASRDPAAAPAGAYKIDPEHASVVARISHSGVSITTLRFGGVEGQLQWNPVRPEDSSVHVAIDTASVSTPIKYNNPPTKEGFLDVLKFPQATFVSTSIRRTGPTHGQISGNLTLRGVTQPVVIDAEMVGVNKVVGGFTGLGFSGVMKIKRSAFGSTYLAQAVGDDIELVLDIEFLKV